MTQNGQVSFWWNRLGLPTPRAPLSGPVEADVCIVGAGYTGLWTAYYLRMRAPSLRVVIVESRFAGYGASGRNGGWLTNSITGGRDQYVAQHGHESVSAFQLALNQSVDEVIRVTNEQGIDADITRGGEFTVAYNPAQLERITAFGRSEADWPHTDVDFLHADQARERVNVEGTLGALWHPHAARVDPAKLVRGLAGAVERLGVRIYESTTALAIRPREVTTDRGTITAEFVIRATEGFTSQLRGERRTWLPLNSSLIVTEPLDAAIWRSIGWDGREVLGDAAHAYMYAQRTADDRIAIGGRGVPYRYGSAIDLDGETPARTITALQKILARFFPATSDSRIDHAWSGVLGVPRDWSATCSFDRSTGLGLAGGYVGTGVSTTNLAGRTLADLILGERTEITRLPWVDHRVRRWEPEPLRWIAVTGLYKAYGYADRAELRGRTKTPTIARVADVISGRGH